MDASHLPYFVTDTIQYLINGIAQGSIYALVALGYTMVYGIIKLVNFAHSEFFMFGAFVGYYSIGYLHLPFYIALPASMIITGLLAVIVEKLAYKPIRHAGKITALITALGISLLMQNLGQKLVGADPKAFPPVFEEVTYNFGEIMVSKIQVIILVVTIILMFLLHTLVMHTKIGRAMRATSYSHDAASLMGINTDNIISFTFFIGASLAGAAGVLIGIYYNTVEPLMGLVPGLKAFVAAVLGGIGIIPGAVIGGLALGVVENLVVGFWVSTYRDAVAFTLLIIILLFKPSGLLGKHRKEKV